MSKDYNENPDDCKYCGVRLDIDSLYQGRQYHKWDPDCSYKHNQFLGKMRKLRASKLPHHQRFLKWVERELDNGRRTEFNIHPLLTIILSKKHIALTQKQQREIPQ